MIPHPSPYSSSESAGTGWVGVTDSLIGGAVLLLVVALAAGNQLFNSDNQVNSMVSQLAEKQEAINKIQFELEALKSENNILWKTKIELLAKIEGLKFSSDELQKEFFKVQEQIDELLCSNHDFIGKIAELSDKQSLLDSIKVFLGSEEKFLLSNIKELKTRLEATSDLNISKDEISDLINKSKTLRKIVNLFSKSESDLLAHLSDLKSEVQNLKKQMAELAESDKTKIKIDRLHYNDLLEKSKAFSDLANKPKASSVHAELLSIKGNLQKVAIILDFSGSMTEQRESQESRWSVAKKYIDNVCEYLDMNECFLIVFSYDIKVFGSSNTNFVVKPESPGFESNDLKQIAAGYTTRRPLNDNEINTIYQLSQLTENEKAYIKNVKPFKLNGFANDRKLLTHTVAQLPTPVGGTNTLKALNAALLIDGITNILLFTDGEPGLLSEIMTTEEKEKFKRDGVRLKPPDFSWQRFWVYKTIDDQKKLFLKTGREFPKINAIGVGNYFDTDLAQFLRTISEEKTGGSFQGR